MKQEKVSLVITCKCGSKIQIEELTKKFGKYYCPKCEVEIKNIVNK